MSGYVANIPQAKREAELEGVTPADIHAQRWAEYEKYSKEPAPPAEKIRIALRIGLFFDGTGNNASNSAFGVLCGAHHPVQQEDLDASCRPYMGDPDSSYGNDVTNVRSCMTSTWTALHRKVRGLKNGYPAGCTSRESAPERVKKIAS